MKGKDCLPQDSVGFVLTMRDTLHSGWNLKSFRILPAVGGVGIRNQDPKSSSTSLVPVREHLLVCPRYRHTDSSRV